MTLDEIAHAMNETRTTLREQCPKGKWSQSEKRGLARREFVHRAFAAGHEPEAIGAFIDRSAIMVQHALRMICVDELHTEYGLTQAEINFQLRGRAA